MPKVRENMQRSKTHDVGRKSPRLSLPTKRVLKGRFRM